MERSRGPAARALAALWHGVDAARRATLNVLFVAVVVFLVVLWFRGGPKVGRGVALVIEPRGRLTEQESGAPGGPTDLLYGGRGPETRVRDVVAALDEAAGDARIRGVVLPVDRFEGGGLSKLEAVGRAIDRFRKSGKKVVAFGRHYEQSAYFVAAHADEVVLDPLGLLAIEGYGGYLDYYRDALDKLGVDVHVFKVGKFKSAVEPYTRNDMSEADRQARLDYLGDLWRAWRDGVAAARPGKVTAERLDEIARTLPDVVREHDGSFAKAALATGLVDRLESLDALRQRLAETYGKDEDTGSFRQVGMDAYLEDTGALQPESGGPAVAILVASGEIRDGDQPPGTIGGDSTARLIRRARNDDDVKALVLRVDSPGGSVMASEVIRRELERTRESGKPVVVSMSSLAASGGYWISTASDEIWANPTTLTGSIGVFWMVPTAERGLAKLGIHADGATVAPYADPLRLDRPLAPEVSAMLQASVDSTYREFLERVAKARRMKVEDVDAIAQGRVWSGAAAKRLGLVDHLGGLDQAVAAAAKRAGLGNEFVVRYLERRPTWRDRLVAALLRRIGLEGVADRVAGPWRDALDDLGRLAQHDRRAGPWALCGCGEP